MKVDDYKWCAQKHLKTCSRMLDYYKSSLFSDNSATEQEKSEFLLEIYYLLGYVIEGLAVYIAHTMPYMFTTNSKTISSHSWKSDSAAKKNEELRERLPFIVPEAIKKFLQLFLRYLTICIV